MPTRNYAFVEYSSIRDAVAAKDALDGRQVLGDLVVVRFGKVYTLTVYINLDLGRKFRCL